MRTFIIYLKIIFFFMRSLPDRNKARKLKKKGDDGYLALLRKWYDKAMTAFPKYLGIELTVTGRENLSRDHAVIFVSNHQSYPDPITIFYALGFPCSVLAKKEVEKIPFICGWMEVLDCVYIDREDARKSLTALKQASDNVKSGKSIIIFPEGTRTHDGTLGEFKAGAFRVAETTHAPIVPVRLCNMHNVMRRGSLKINRANVRVDILPEIDISQMSKMEIRALPEKIKEMIADGREEMV